MVIISHEKTMVRMSPSRSNQAADHTVLHLAVSAGEEIDSSLPVAAAAAGCDGRDETWATAGSGPNRIPGATSEMLVLYGFIIDFMSI